MRLKINIILGLCLVVVCCYGIRRKRQENDKCYVENIALVGGDLPVNEGGNGVESSSLSDCLGKCLERTKCYYWTYVREWRVNCFLKGKKGGSEQDLKGAITGWIAENCDYTEGKNEEEEEAKKDQKQEETTAKKRKEDCELKDVALLGGDLSKDDGGDGVQTSTKDECSSLCQSNPVCSAWTFVEQWNINCYLKKEVIEKSEFRGAVSGTSCGGGSGGGKSEDKDSLRRRRKDGEECRFKDTNFLGGDLEAKDGGLGIEVADADACSDECRKRITPKCNYWTFVKKWKVNCYLKARLGQKSDFEGGESGTYGDKCDLKSQPLSESTDPVPDGAGCRFPGLNFLAGDLSKKDGGHGIVTKDVEDCKRECSIRRNCQFWTFVSQWKVNCYLKKTKGPDQELSGAISGSLIIPCDEAVVEEDLSALEDTRTNDHECRYEETNFIGSDLPKSHGGLGISTSSAEECRLECFKKLFCKHWTRIEGWKVDCYLKTGHASAEHKEGATSGSIGLPCNKTAIILQNNQFNLPKPDSSSSSSSSSDETKMTCTYPGINYQGGDLSDSDGGNGLVTSSAEGCSEECQKRHLCQYWTFVDGWKVNCYLKSRFDEENEKDGATSGSIGKPCDESKVIKKKKKKMKRKRPASALPKVKSPFARVPTSPKTDIGSVCFFHGVKLIGGDLPASKSGIESNDPSDCAVKCYRTRSCRYWVHISGGGGGGRKNNCYLKSGFDSEEDEEGVTSGSLGYSCS